MQHCPSCRSERDYTSRARSRWESWRKARTGKRPYRCRACDWRGWAQDSGPHFSADQIASAARAVAADPSNLKDTEPGHSRRGVDLATLDESISTLQDSVRV